MAYNLVIREHIVGDHIADWHTDIIEFVDGAVTVFIDTDTDNVASFLEYVAHRGGLEKTREHRDVGDATVIIHTWTSAS